MPAVVKNNFRLSLSYVLDNKQGVACKLIHMEIKAIDGIFPLLAAQEFVLVTDGTNVEYPYTLNIGSDQKSLNARFAYDAFVGLTGVVQIMFGHWGGGTATFDNISISTSIDALPPPLATLPVTNATKLFLGI